MGTLPLDGIGKSCNLTTIKHDCSGWNCVPPCSREQEEEEEEEEDNRFYGPN